MEYTKISERDIKERDDICQPLKLGQSVSRKKARESITYFCYHQLGITPYVWQHILFKEMMYNDRDILINTPRQVGKSFAVAVSALHAVIYNTIPIDSKGNRTIIGIASKSEKQAMKLLSDIRTLIAIGDLHVEQRYKVKNFFSAHISTRQTDTNSKTELTLRSPVKNDKGLLVPEGKVIGQVICTPATDSARGNTFSRFLMDEAAFFDMEDFYDTIAEPTLRTTRGHSVVTTTPNGQKGWFYKVFDPEDTMEKNPYFRMWLHYNHIENEDEKSDVVEKKLPKSIREGTHKKFQQEYEAMFTADDESFFDSEKVDLGIDFVHIPSPEPSYPNPTDMGIDIGFTTANTILCITRLDKDNIAHLVFHKIYPPEGDLDLIKDVMELIPQYNVQRVTMDECAAASAFIQQAKKEGRINLNLMSFKRDKQNKYFQFKSKLYKEEIKYYNEKRLVQEMKALTGTAQQNGTKICKPSGGSDDFIDAFLMSCYFFIDEKINPLKVHKWNPEQYAGKGLSRGRGRKNKITSGRLKDNITIRSE